MMTKEQIEADLDELYDARRAIIRAQEYTTSDGRRLRRADLEEINSTITQLERQLTRLKAGGGLMAKRIVPYGV